MVSTSRLPCGHSCCWQRRGVSESTLTTGDEELDRELPREVSGLPSQAA